MQIVAAARSMALAGGRSPNNEADWVVYGLLCWGGGEKCMGNEGRGVAYVTIDDTKLAF